MIRCGLLFLFLCALFPIDELKAGWWSESLSPKAERAKKTLEGLDALIEQAMIDFQVPGMAVGVTVDGHVVYSKGFGKRDVEGKLPFTTETLFPIGSCSKAFMTFALGTLVDEGLVEWDTPVIDVLPEFHLWDQYATQNLTLRDILTNRSGLPRHDFMWYNTKLTPTEILQRLRYLEPACDIRERFHYNTMMFFVAGCAMEKVLGKSWKQTYAERILKPLGMNRTNFSKEELLRSENFALPYIGKVDGLKKMPLRDFSVFGSGASINSCLSDMLLWVGPHLNQGMAKGKPVISSPTLKEMHTPQTLLTGYPETKEAQVAAYGLGWYVQSYRGQYNISHDGGLDGFTSLVSLLPNAKIGVVILCNKNLSPLPRFLSVHLFDRLLELPQIEWMKEALEGLQKNKQTDESNYPLEDFSGEYANQTGGQTTKKEDVLRKKETNPSHSIDEYAGEYFHPGYGTLQVQCKDGQLSFVYNDIEYGLEHWHYDVFNITGESEEIILTRQNMKIAFRNTLQGEVGEVLVPFETNVADIAFKKKPTSRHATLEYLRKFVGPYEVSGYVVDIVVRNNSLFAVVPGRPFDELIPNGVNQFTVKSMPGYTVTFQTDALGEVETVRLETPFGGWGYTGKPKKN